MRQPRIVAATFATLLAVGCGDAPAPAGEAPAGTQLASAAPVEHRPAEAGPITVYKSPT